MIHLDLFSGIGGFSKGLIDAGLPIRKTYYSEVDKHAIAVYKHNFPDAIHVGSVESIRGETLPQVDIMTFGFPCQDLSVAGKQAGLAGTRSGLFYQATRLLRETKARTFIWENVEGLLSSNKGKDIKAVCEELYYSGYIFDIETVNTAWILPQNRVRLYSVGFSIKHLYECLGETNGQRTNLNLFVRITEGYLTHRLAKNSTVLQRESPIAQYGLVLEREKARSQSDLNGQKLKSIFLGLITNLALADLKSCYHDLRKLLSKQKSINSNSLSAENTGTTVTDIRYDMTEKTERNKFISCIETLLRSLSDENWLKESAFIILTLTSAITQLTTFSSVQMQQSIEGFIALSALLYPNLWDLALLNLIEKKKHTAYVQNFRSKSSNTAGNNYALFPLSDIPTLSGSLMGHLDRASRPGVFPFRESDFENQAAGRETVNCIDANYGKGIDNHAQLSVVRGIKVLENNGSQSGRVYDAKGIAPTLTRGSDVSGTNIPVIQLNNSRESGNKQPYQQNPVYDPDGIAPALTAQLPTGSPAIVTRPRGYNKGGESAICGTISANSFEQNHFVKLTELTKNESDAFRIYDADGLARTLKAEGGGGGALMGACKVGETYRYLTEIECERLQGFPDSWTQWGLYHKSIFTNKRINLLLAKGYTEHGDYLRIPVPKTQRYKLCGNAVTATLVTLIGKRLLNSLNHV